MHVDDDESGLSRVDSDEGRGSGAKGEALRRERRKRACVREIEPGFRGVEPEGCFILAATIATTDDSLIMIIFAVWGHGRRLDDQLIHRRR